MKITLVELVLVLLGTLKEQEETHVSQQRINIWGCSENFDDCGTARAELLKMNINLSGWVL